MSLAVLPSSPAAFFSRLCAVLQLFLSTRSTRSLLSELEGPQHAAQACLEWRDAYSEASLAQRGNVQPSILGTRGTARLLAVTAQLLGLHTDHLACIDKPELDEAAQQRHESADR